MERLQEQYNKQIIPALQKEFGYGNVMQVPKVQKIVLNVGVGKFVKEFPHHRHELTDLLIGRVFDGRDKPIFKDLEPFLDRMAKELPPDDPTAEPEDADVPAIA